MAQHFIYIIAPEHGLGHVKIGFTNNVQRRLNELQTGHPERLKIFFTKEVSGRKKANLLEDRIHARLVSKRLTGEWFDVTPEFAQLVVTTSEMSLGMDEEARKLKLEELQERFDDLRQQDQQLTEQLADARALLEDIQARWTANLQEWQRVREQLDFYKLDDAA